MYFFFFLSEGFCYNLIDRNGFNHHWQFILWTIHCTNEYILQCIWAAAVYVMQSRVYDVRSIQGLTSRAHSFKHFHELHAFKEYIFCCCRVFFFESFELERYPIYFAGAFYFAAISSIGASFSFFFLVLAIFFGFLMTHHQQKHKCVYHDFFFSYLISMPTLKYEMNEKSEEMANERQRQ